MWSRSSFSLPPFFIPGPFLLPCYQLGSQPSTAMFHSEENGSKGMDPLVLIDAIAICMAYEEKELCKIGEVALAVIFDVASIILGSKERVSFFFFVIDLTSYLCKHSLRSLITNILYLICTIPFIFSPDSLLITLVFAPPGVPIAFILLHSWASVCLLLWAGLVRQTRGCGVHQVSDGKTASDLGATEPAHFPQSPAFCHDGPHWRGEVVETDIFLVVLFAFFLFPPAAGEV